MSVSHAESTFITDKSFLSHFFPADYVSALFADLIREGKIRKTTPPPRVNDFAEFRKHRNVRNHSIPTMNKLNEEL